VDAPAASRRSGSLDRISVLLLGAHALVWLAVLAFHPTDALSDDVARFVQVAGAPGIPYRDVPVEYMPLETGLIRLVLDASLNDAAVRVAIISVVCDVVAFLLVRSLAGDVAGRWYLVLALPLQVFMLFRLDMVAVVLVLASIWLARSERRTASGVLFAAALLFKVWPIVLLPLLWRRAGRRGTIVAGALATAGVLLWVVVGGVDAPGQVTGFRGATGWHLESTVGALVSIVGDTPVRFELGTLRVGTMTDAALWGLRIATVIAVVAVWWRSSRRPDAVPEGAWIVPWSAVAAAERGRRVATGAILLAGGLAASSFLIYWEIAGGVRELEVISLVRALCVFAIPVAWLLERPATVR
jgi:hypothetical protein